ncbi:MAG TPA: ATP-binding protein [Flavipsychrobacter sp.]|nr:ATP-binding protein [Flavipsychrobacter sp.]
MSDTENSKELHSLRSQLQTLQVKNEVLSKQNDELESFAYIASHDLQEPLRKINIFSERILELEGDKFSDKAKDSFARIQNAVGRMQKLIDALLHYSRTNTDEKIFFKRNLNELVNDALQQHKEKIEETQAVIEVGKLPEVQVIPHQFTQLIENIISNALKYSKPTTIPYIRITASETSLSLIKEPLFAGAAAEDRYWRIDVADNGIGFDMKYKDKIFELFQRLHGKHEYEGSGIGLSICKKVVQNHNGFMHVESTPGEGSTFSVLLPSFQ